MARPSQNRDDPRTRYGHTAYDVSYAGIAPERGPSGNNTMLACTYRGAFQFTTPADVATPQIVGDIPMGVWIDGFVIHNELTSGTFSLVLKGVGGGPDITLIEGLTGDLTDAGPTVLDNPVYLPLANSRPLEMTITGGTAGEVVVASLLATAAETGWK